MKRLLILLLFTLLSTCSYKPLSVLEVMINTIIKYRPVDGVRIASCLHSAALEYKHDPLMIMRLCWKESRYKPNAYNSKTQARGLMQILDYYWRVGLYKIQDGELGRYLTKKNITNIERLKRYYYRINYSSHLGCYALASCIKYKKGDIRKGLTMYSGFYVKGSCRKKRKKYLDYILGE